MAFSGFQARSSFTLIPVSLLLAHLRYAYMQTHVPISWRFSRIVLNSTLLYKLSYHLLHLLLRCRDVILLPLLYFVPFESAKIYRERTTLALSHLIKYRRRYFTLSSTPYSRNFCNFFFWVFFNC